MVNSGNQNDAGESSTNGPGEISNSTSRSGTQRRRFLKFAGAGSAVALAGCIGDGGGDEDSPDGDGTDGDGTTDDDGGGSEPTPTEPLKIGVLAPGTGTKHPIGNSIAKSAELAANQLNEDGGVFGNDVEVVVKETNENPQTGKTKYEELTVGEQVDFTTGVFTSEVLLNLMDSIASQEKVHLGSGAATPDAARMVKEDYETYKYWFRTGPINAHFLGQNMVDFASKNFSDMGWDSVYVLVEDFAWTKPVDTVLSNSLADAGVEVAGMNRYAGGTKDFSAIYDQVESSDADAAYVAMAHTGSTAIVQWAKQQRDFEFGGIHVPMQLPSYYELTNGACRYGVTQNSATPTSEITDKTVPYANAYKEMVGKFPVYTGYITFDAVKMYAAAAEEAGSYAADDVIPELESMTYTGTAGPIRYYGKDARYPHDVVYDPSGEDGVRPLWLQWQEQDGAGTQVPIHPDSVKTGSYEKPPWI